MKKSENMDITYLALIALSIYTMLDSIFDHILDKDIERLKKEVEELRKQLREAIQKKGNNK